MSPGRARFFRPSRAARSSNKLMLGFDANSKSDHGLWKNSPLEFLAPPIARFASDQISRFFFLSRIGLEQFPENPLRDTHHCKL